MRSQICQELMIKLLNAFKEFQELRRMAFRILQLPECGFIQKPSFHYSVAYSVHLDNILSKDRR